MTGLCSLEGDLRSLEVTHFSDEDHFGCLPQSGAQGGGEIRRILAYLTLIDGRILVNMQVLDRILDRHDMVVFLLVNDVDDRRLGGALAGSSGAGNQNKTVA